LSLVLNMYKHVASTGLKLRLKHLHYNSLVRCQRVATASDCKYLMSAMRGGVVKFLALVYLRKLLLIALTVWSAADPSVFRNVSNFSIDMVDSEDTQDKSSPIATHSAIRIRDYLS
jgi:hypothetical protein